MPFFLFRLIAPHRAGHENINQFLDVPVHLPFRHTALLMISSDLK
jgi:hypothetical protein